MLQARETLRDEVAKGSQALTRVKAFQQNKFIRRRKSVLLKSSEENDSGSSHLFAGGE